MRYGATPAMMDKSENAAGGPFAAQKCSPGCGV